MSYLHIMYVLGVCSCFCWAKDDHIVFEATRTIYNVGGTVTLTCYIKSNWLGVSFERNNTELGLCYAINKVCAPSDGMRAEHGNYELKLEKSHLMLVIKNVTKDDDGVDFTCHWTSYTATISFAVTAITTPSMPDKNMSDSNVVPASVLVPGLVPVIVLVIVPAIVLVIVIVVVKVRQPALYRRIGDLLSATVRE